MSNTESKSDEWDLWMVKTPSPSHASGSIYSSKPATFVVQGTTFYIHSKLVSRLSKHLELKIIQAAEVQEQLVVLEDIEASTFARFLEWAYQGHYKPGECVCRPQDVASSDNEAVEGTEESAPADESVVFEEPPAAEEVPADDVPAALCESEPAEDAVWGCFTHKHKSTAKFKNKISGKNLPNPTKYPRLVLKEEFANRHSTVRKENITIPLPRSNQGPDEDYTDVFLSHAKLYVFAKTYDINDLRMLALDNLHSVLVLFKLYRERTSDIIATLRYAYKETSMGITGLEEDLRKLLSDYVAYEMDTLIQDDNFRTLMIEDGGVMLGAFLKLVRKRIE